MSYTFSATQVKELMQQHFNLAVSVKELTGYDEANFLVREDNGNAYICKIADASHQVAFLDAQVKILEHLAASAVGKQLQQVVKNTRGEGITRIEIDGDLYHLRVLTWLEGEPMATVPPATALNTALGEFLGKMDAALAGFSHPAMHRHYAWDLAQAAIAGQQLVHIKDPEHRRLAGYFLLQFDTVVAPALPQLRKAYIHNDANDYNILIRQTEISGLIDFGDMVYTQLVNNLAIACTYVMLSAKDPLAAAVETVAAYHAVYPLTVAETDLLYYLVAARLCISVTTSAAQAAAGSDNAYHFVTEAPAWQLLSHLITINPLAAQDAFRRACGFTPLINAEADYAGLLADRKAHIGRNLSISYQEPLKIVRGALQYLYDDKGRTFIDCVNNPSHVGHCHPTVVRAMQQQIATLNTNTRYLHDHLVDYANSLISTLPPSLEVCYFTNSGSEANDLAIRMSRHYTQQQDVIVLDHAYHGTSTVAMQLSPYKFDGKGGFGQPAHTHKALNPDQYRGAYRYDDAQAGPRYAADVQDIISRLQANGKGVAAYICETLLGVGGQIPLPPGYLQEAYAAVRAAGGLCIADEVQVGFGRVGDAFWGFELQGVTPDIVVMGKPIGNGHPLAAVVTTRAVADAFNNGMEYFNTFGGNPVSMATGLAVLQVIREEGLQEHARVTGNYFMEGLRKLKAKHAIIGDVRGHGFFIGAELVRDRETLEPAVPEIDVIVEAMKQRGFLLSTDGPLHNVLKIKPPMVFNKANTDALLHHLDAVLDSL
ncbi:aminotransferase class III-fold pyridoxal phosphate-dependent enzyme [Chitinophaga nivalis]|uniref:Aminotransferase class III-fold pyridoxal phosphate-dependent enzyme n=1 Tax=Chitinophaga nivalis TaxID=2991709 RepID=A0ABT3IP39_9BACT|nr:aminotransferase class III-fold pyridoxal phosphate-dependent enzyme [Chitinophaga nivalis]MCW3464648.1 aminotransferase class III-fold pyridoxal phosphate-dependent enzyme [Chitinophaga nivalis]MCW3485661.1 aminotransferase class III-fold pyridoxal phosphate-dependent enzyme [Chitinophaga nivalis]